MGQWDAGIGRHGDCRADAGNDLERYSRSAKRFGLLPSPTEDERIAAFEPDDTMTAARMGDEEIVNLLLRESVVAGSLADEYPARLRGNLFQQGRIDQPIIDHYVGAAY